MSSLSSQVKQVLEHAVSGANAPAGLVFGAINRNGEILVAEAAGRAALDKDEPVRYSQRYISNA